MAARNISDIFGLVNYITRTQRGVFISPTEFNSVMTASQLELYQYLWELSYKSEQQLHDGLQPFKVLRYQFASNSGGLVTFPSDYTHLFLGVFSIYGSTVCPVQFVDNEQVPDALNNQLRVVSLMNPIAEAAPNGFQMYPIASQIGYFSYLRLPAQVVYGYTQNGRAITYDPTTSVQIEFKDTYVNNIISRALKYFGVSMSESEIEQFAQSQTQQTQTP